MSFMDKLKNKFEKAKGRGKQSAGRKTGDRRLEAEGDKERLAGGAKQVGEQAKDAAKETRRTFE